MMRPVYSSGIFMNNLSYGSYNKSPIFSKWARVWNLQFVAFPAHGFNQDCQVQLASAGDLKGIGGGGLLNSEADIGLCLFPESFPQVAGGYVFSFFPGEGAVVYCECHGQCWFVDGQQWEGDGVFYVANGLTDVDIFQPGEGYDPPVPARSVSMRFRPS